MISSQLFPWTIVDITQTITPQSKGYEETSSCTLTTILDYHECLSKTKFHVQELKMPLGMGTHLDAPAHAHPLKKTIDAIPLAELILPLVVVDCTKVQTREYLKIDVHELELFESINGVIPEQSFVYLYTGWSSFWNQPDQYRNKQSDGSFCYPTLTNNAIERLIARQIKGIGIDTLSPDTAPDFYAHAQLLSRNILMVENLAKPENIPATGALIGIFPIKLEGATESPARVVVLVRNNVL